VLDKIIEFIKSAGNYAQANQANIDFAGENLKAKRLRDILTETDMEISRRFAEFVRSEFADLDYIIVDEESVADLGADPMREIKKHEYAFVIDPIDGTLTYSVGLPYFGVSIGVFKDQQPLIGAVFAPSLGLLAYSGEKQAWIEENGVRRELTRLAETAPLVVSSWGCEPEPAALRAVNVREANFYALVVNGLYAATGALRCWATDKGNIWDYAGVYTLFAKVGVEMFDPVTNSPIRNLFDDDIFDKKLHIKGMKLICLPKHYDDFKKFYKL
jgi:myo-inositol-1(or 4)-monophosphatase